MKMILLVITLTNWDVTLEFCLISTHTSEKYIPASRPQMCMLYILPRILLIARLLCHPVFTEIENTIESEYFGKYILLILNCNFILYSSMYLPKSMCVCVLCVPLAYKVQHRALALMDLRFQILWLWQIFYLLLRSWKTSENSWRRET